MHAPHISGFSGISARFVHLMLALVLALLALGPLSRLQLAASPSPPSSPKLSLFAQQPLAFVPLAGGEDGEAGFRAGAVTFAPRTIDFALPVLPAGAPPEAVQEPDIAPAVSFESLQLQFLNLEAMPVIEPETLLPGRVNDLRGSGPAGWQVGQPTYGAIVYRELYPGIELRYDGQAGHLKGTFIIAPGADPARIAWRYQRAAGVSLDTADGSLVVDTGSARLEEQVPVAWQESSNGRVPVPAAYAVAADGQVGFTLPAGYDPSLPLIIDPVYVYQTIYNGAFLDHGVVIDLDPQGNAYALAYSYDQNNNDLYVAKVAPDGTLLWTTYFHGSGVDFGSGLAVDGQGDVYITGQTGSADFPVVNAMQSQMNGPGDAFISRLASSDGSLVFSTFFGGSRHEQGRALVIGSNGDIYLTGATDSTDFPTVDPIQPNLNLTSCFCYDSFVTRLSGDGSTVLYSTYLGGALMDEGTAIGLDGTGNIYFAGNTRSSDFPLASPIQATFGGELYDAFAARIASDGSTLDYSTFLGGEEWDIANDIAVDDVGNAYLTGFTGSQAYPTTPGAFQPQFVGGIDACGQPPFEPIRNCYDVYVSKLAPDGASFGYSTFIAGGRDDVGRGIALDGAGNAYVIGYTSSPDFPMHGSPDPGIIIFIAKLNASGSALAYVLGIDSGSPNAGLDIAVDGLNDLYVTGALNVPADLFVARIDQVPCPDFAPPSGVGAEDIATVAGHWGETPASPGWDPDLDLNGDNVINLVDVMTAAGNWGRMCLE